VIGSQGKRVGRNDWFSLEWGIRVCIGLPKLE
jgi:hypothetical protein